MENCDKLKCTKCGADLELSVGFDGADWDSVKGEGSGFDYSIKLSCIGKCGRIYNIGRVKNAMDFCENIEKLRPYEKDEYLREGENSNVNI